MFELPPNAIISPLSLTRKHAIRRRLPAGASMRHLAAASHRPVQQRMSFGLHLPTTSDVRWSIMSWSMNANASASSAERLRIDMAVMNCARCHDNEGNGGKSLDRFWAERRQRDYISPPTLTRVGERLRTERLQQWVSQGAREKAMRPWVGAKMAGFGVRGTRIADALLFAMGSAEPSIPARRRRQFMPRNSVPSGSRQAEF